MANNKAIQILRTNEIIDANKGVALLDGQPFYNKQKNYLTVGHEENGVVTQKPITVREMVGYFDDVECVVPDGTTEGTLTQSSDSRISNACGDEYSIKSIVTKDENGAVTEQKLVIDSSKGLELHADDGITATSTLSVTEGPIYVQDTNEDGTPKVEADGVTPVYKYADITQVARLQELKNLEDNLNTDGVKFSRDLRITEKLGRFNPANSAPSGDAWVDQIKSSNGNWYINTKNKSIQALFEAAYSKSQAPTITPPSIEVSDVIKSYEVGTNLSLNETEVTAELKTGSYSYGSVNSSGGDYTSSTSTGITATNIEIKIVSGTDEDGNDIVIKSNSDSNTNEVSTSLTASEISNTRITDSGFHYEVKASATYPDSTRYPVDNLKNEYKDSQGNRKNIVGSTIETNNSNKGTISISGFRKTFYGTKTDHTLEANINSGLIRGLSKSSTSSLSNGSTFTVDIPIGAKSVIIAYPNGLRDLSSVTDENDSNSQIKSVFSKTTTTVYGATNNQDGATYKVFTLNFADATFETNKYHVMI